MRDIICPTDPFERVYIDLSAGAEKRRKRAPAVHVELWMQLFLFNEKIQFNFLNDQAHARTPLDECR